MDVDILAFMFRFGVDIDLDPVADQEFIGQQGSAHLQEPLWLHFCDKAIDLNLSAARYLTVGSKWESSLSNDQASGLTGVLQLPSRLPCQAPASEQSRNGHTDHHG